MTNQKSQLPTTFVVLGVTGDLMTKKIAPALFNFARAWAFVAALPARRRFAPRLDGR